MVEKSPRRGPARQSAAPIRQFAAPGPLVLPLPVVLGAAWVGGAAVMIVEVVGTRVLTPFFGVGLYVWSALLLVTLGSLAVGYYVGGHLADRQSRLGLPLQLIGAGVLLALAPLLRTAVLRATSGLELRVGAIVAATVLFAPALGLLGMVSTTAIKLSLKSTQGAGRAAGIVYALSTVGSLIGTLAAGFWLIPNFPIPTILWSTATLLILTGASCLRTGKAAAALAAWVPLLLTFLSPNTSGPAPWRVLDRAASLYGSLAVIEDASRSVPLRLLKADHSLIGAEWQGGSPAFGFIHVLEAATLARPTAQRALVVGLGVGSVVEHLIASGITVDVAELDPNVVLMAGRYFDFGTNGRVYIGDARALLGRLQGPYDLLFHDTFTGGATPEHLLSLEVMETIKGLLTPTGLLVLNMVGSAEGPLAPATLAVHHTLTAAFPRVQVFADGPNPRDGNLHNLVFFASAGPLDFGRAVRSTGPASTRQQVFAQFQDWQVRLPPGGSLITDDQNPMARLGAPISAEYHARMREMYPLEFWLLN